MREAMKLLEKLDKLFISTVSLVAHRHDGWFLSSVPVCIMHMLETKDTRLILRVSWAFIKEFHLNFSLAPAAR